MEKESTVLMRLSEMDKLLAVTEDPIDLKKGSDVIEAIRSLAKLSHMSLDIVNHAFSERVKWDRKRGQWISKNIDPKGGRPITNPVAVSYTLADIETDDHESTFCQRLIAIQDQEIMNLIKICNGKKKEISKAGLLRWVSDGHIEPDMTVPPGLFSVVYADPPWKYSNFNQQNAAAAKYTVLDIEDICLFGNGLADVTFPQTVLFMWAVNPLLEEALEVLKRWGFKYKTNIVWDKGKSKGKSWWVKPQHELLLIGVRAKTPHPKIMPPSVIHAERPQEHSEKPEVFYEAIENMFPLGDKTHLVMFARTEREGWVCHGDEL